MMPMQAPPDRQLDRPRASIRMDARLDATTRQKVDDLAKHFHCPRAEVLCYTMRWGLSRGETLAVGQGDSPGPVRHLYLYVDSGLHEQVEKAATAARAKVAPWLRHMVRQITIADFPASWREVRAEERSHESRRYGKRFMLRLDDRTWAMLDTWSTRFERSAAEIIRWLLAQATPDTFPASWHRRVAERHGEQVQPVPCKADYEA